ncbi:MAG: putative ABC transport system ATP-binding protein [Bradymonadia bacterium]|jgi:putative ABC transport system ATP-binding protein
MGHPLHAFFARIPHFSGLSPSELEEIIRAVHPLEIKAGERLFGEGDPGDAAFIIQTGRVEIFRLIDGEEIPLVELGQGEVVGELALIDGAARSAACRVLEDATLLRLDKTEFDYLRANMRPAAYTIIRSLTATICARIRNTNDQIGDLLAPPGPRPEPELPSKRSWLSRLFGGRR